MFKKKQRQDQTQLWIATHELDAPRTLPFYNALDRVLDEMRFGDHVREWCSPYYKMSGPGYPGVDPEVYFKMLMVGFFEGITSERGIDLRCSDSCGIRTFLGYGLTEKTPTHATLGNIRRRLPEDVFEKVFDLLQKQLAEHDLLKGRHLGIDSSVIEANASLRELRHKKTQHKYRAYVKKLAEADGVDASDEHAVNRYDRKRKGKKLSNNDWEHPHDPDARIGRDKKGSTRMLYKAEHIVDLETNAIIGARILPGDEGDAEHPSDHLLESEMRTAAAVDSEEPDLPVKTLTGDMGYHSSREVHALQSEYGIIANIPDPILKRNLEKLTEEERESLEASRAYTKSEEGRKLQRKRAEYIERSFAHTLESGGMRRTTLRGTENIYKRYQVAAFCANMSLLLRTLFRIGTPKQCAAMGMKLVDFLFDLVFSKLRVVIFLGLSRFRIRDGIPRHGGFNGVTALSLPQCEFQP